MDALVRPVRLFAVPAGQPKQLTEPVLGWYVLAAHGGQTAVPDKGAYVPIAHGLQPGCAFKPFVCLPALQLSQVDAPVEPWYLPASQAVQKVAPAAEYSPRAHEEHAAWPEAA